MTITATFQSPLSSPSPAGNALISALTFLLVISNSSGVGVQLQALTPLLPPNIGVVVDFDFGSSGALAAIPAGGSISMPVKVSVLSPQPNDSAVTGPYQFALGCVVQTNDPGGAVLASPVTISIPSSLSGAIPFDPVRGL